MPLVKRKRTIYQERNAPGEKNSKLRLTGMAERKCLTGEKLAQMFVIGKSKTISTCFKHIKTTPLQISGKSWLQKSE